MNALRSKKSSKDVMLPQRVHSMNSGVRPVMEKGPKVPKKPRKYRPGSMHLEKLLKEEFPDGENRRPSMVDKLRRKLSTAPIDETENKTENPAFDNGGAPPPPEEEPPAVPKKPKSKSKKSKK